VYEAEANQWFDQVLKTVGNVAIATVNPEPVVAKKAGKQLYNGIVLTNINLNDRGSNKETWHIEFEAPDVEYLCGDSIGIIPENDAQLVTDIISITNADGNKSLLYKNEKYTLHELLKKKINIIHLTERLVKQYASVTGHAIPEGRCNLYTLLKNFPVKNVAQFEEILVGLNAISPRLYTIASSPNAHPGEVHVIVAKDQYEYDGKRAIGLCSDYLGKLPVNKQQTFFVQPNKRFRLPAAEKDIIFVGPGTGIAAFRSFIAERDATSASGRNWLFFGEQQFATDFLYQTELQQWFETGVLTKISLAFSRDQQEKLYVQHKMLQQAEELYTWLESGAYLFISGKKDPMSIKVEQTLLTIIQQQGNKSLEAAKQYLEQLEEEGRYEKDVY
jgi:sulfite reductase (NADPH) flavoprotein alpha-component